MRLTPLVATGALLLAGAMTPASAATKKPISKSHDVTAPAPDPTNYVSLAAGGYSVCAQRVPQSFQTFEFKAPAPGKLAVKLTGFTGDWDLLIMDKSNNELTYGGSDGLNTPQDPAAGDEAAVVKVKKSNFVYKLVACNWAGGSTGKLSYTFTYA